jgi:peptidoglycan/LPS O-acetylase OafA/YrhL
MTDPHSATPPPTNRLLRKLARSTSSGRYLPEIDGLRCFAILAVIVFHLAGYVNQKSPRQFAIPTDQEWTFRLARTGHIGVQLFFIISGFVVSLPFALHHLAEGKKVDLRQYFLRRLIRIEPPYVIALIFWTFAFGLSGLGPAPWREMLGHFPASLFYLHNLIYRAPSIIIPPAWSLEIEIQFYVLAPLLVSVFAINNALLRRSILFIAIAALAIAQHWLRNPGQINGLHLEQEGHYFLIGLLLVDLHVTSWRHRPARLPLLGDLLATGCLAGLIWVLVHNPADTLRVPVLLSFACAGMLRSRIWRAVLRNPWIYTTGGMCYTIYLYHGFFKAFVGHFTIHWQIGDSFTLSFLLQSVILIPIILAGSAILFLLTEKPFMRIRPKFQDRPQPQSQI